MEGRNLTHASIYCEYSPVRTTLPNLLFIPRLMEVIVRECVLTEGKGDNLDSPASPIWPYLRLCQSLI